MKRTKLFSVFITLALVLSLGACNSEENNLLAEDDSNDSETQDGTKESSNSDDHSSNLDGAETPIELIDKACDTGNYSLLMYIYEWISDPFDADDVESGTLTANDVYETMPSTPDAYVIQASYTEDALLYAFYDGSGSFSIAYLCVNTSSRIYGPISNFYYTYDLVNWSYGGFYYDTWQEYYWSLFDNPTYFGLTESSLTFCESVYDTYGDIIDLYTYTNLNVAYALSYMCGPDLWDYYMVDYLEPLDNYVYYYPQYEEMLLYFYGEMWYATDTTYTEYSLYQDQYYCDIYNVGSTNIDSYVNAALASN